MNESQSSLRRVVILRHGERVNFVFGDSWTETAFDGTENYIRTDLNMPESLPARPVEEWKKDTPLTNLGHLQAQLVGESLKAGNVKFSKVFVSPSYRCIKTAEQVLKAMGVLEELPMNVEPGFFDWLGFSVRWGFPSWMSVENLCRTFNVNKSYEAFISREQLEASMNEKVESFYERSFGLMQQILKNTDGDILIVAHGLSLDTCTRQLVGKPPRTFNESMPLTHLIPYLAAITMEQTGESTFKLVDSEWLIATSGSLRSFDWRVLDN